MVLFFYWNLKGVNNFKSKKERLNEITEVHIDLDQLWRDAQNNAIDIKMENMDLKGAYDAFLKMREDIMEIMKTVRELESDARQDLFKH